MITKTVNGREYRLDSPVTTGGMLDAMDAHNGDEKHARRIAPLWAVLLDESGNRYASTDDIGRVVPFADFIELIDAANEIIGGSKSDDAPLVSGESNSTE